MAQQTANSGLNGGYCTPLPLPWDIDLLGKFHLWHTLLSIVQLQLQSSSHSIHHGQCQPFGRSPPPPLQTRTPAASHAHFQVQKRAVSRGGEAGCSCIFLGVQKSLDSPSPPFSRNKFSALFSLFYTLDTTTLRKAPTKPSLHRPGGNCNSSSSDKSNSNSDNISLFPCDRMQQIYWAAFFRSEP